MNPLIAIVLIVIVAAVCVVAWLCARSRPRLGEILPARVLQKKFGQYAEAHPERTRLMTMLKRIEWAATRLSLMAT